MNIYQFAMDMELDGKRFYEELMGKANDKGLKNIFKMLAEDEKKHHDIIKEMRNKGDINVDFKDLGNTDNIFEKLEKNKENFSLDKSEIEVYKHALDIEDKSINFYNKQFEKAKEETEKKIFKTLVEEEKKHKSILENIIDFVNEPNKKIGKKSENADPEFARFESEID
ncbi:MAG: rubrerythrin [Firmicutes bacterium]|nr:rubrerythrin [Bacillota bacterium]